MATSFFNVSVAYDASGMRFCKQRAETLVKQCLQQSKRAQCLLK